MNSASHESETITNHLQAIRYLAVPFARCGIAFEDLIQEGQTALLVASRKWDPSRGVKLWTFARKFVYGAMVRFAVTESAEPCRLKPFKAKRCETEYSYDSGDRYYAPDPWLSAEADLTIETHDPSPEEVLSLKEDLSSLKEDLEELSDIEREVLWSYFGEDRSLRETEAATGHSHGCVQRTFRGAIAKLRARSEWRS